MKPEPKTTEEETIYRFNAEFLTADKKLLDEAKKLSHSASLIEMVRRAVRLYHAILVCVKAEPGELIFRPKASGAKEKVFLLT